MEKWRELFYNSLFNLSVALIAGGILKLVLDFTNVIGAVIILFCGIYLLFAVTIIAKNYEERL